MSGRIEMGEKFTSSLSDAGELVLMIRDFSLADVGEYKVVVENELGAVSQIIKMEMSGRTLLSLSSWESSHDFIHREIHHKFKKTMKQVAKQNILL